MATWLALLRAVNVGGRKFPMDELRRLLSTAGYADVETHIQTGNIRLGSAIRSPARLEAALEALFLADRGFEVPTIVLRPAELSRIAADADEVVDGDRPPFAQYVELLRVEPDEAVRALIEGNPSTGQRAVVRGRAVHLLFDVPYHEVKPPSAAVRRAMGVSTNRNAKVIRVLAQKWGGPAH